MNKSHTPPGFENDEKNIAIDFDGVVHNWDKGWHDGTCYGEPINGALDSIKSLSKNFNIILFTAKARIDRPMVQGKTGVELVEDWCRKYDIMKYITEITSEKPRALIYIDDNGYRFLSWSETMKYVNEKFQ